MKSNQILLLATLLLCTQFCLAQIEIKEEKIDRIKINSESKLQPYFVLKVDDRTLEIGRGLLSNVKLEDINAEWISSVEVWKDQQAIDLYGLKALDGVVIISFKDFNILSKELQDMFNKTKKIE